MQQARVTEWALSTTVLLAFSASAFAVVPTVASTSIEAPAPPTNNVVQNIISQANIVVTVLGTPGVTGAQTSASLATGADETLQFTTSTTDLTPTGGLIMSQEAVSVNVAPISNAPATAEGTSSGGVIVVLAQYN